MVIFWGPAVIFIAAVPTIRPSPDSPSPLFFRNLRTMPPWPGSLTRPSPRSPAFPPGCYGVFLPGDCAPLCWAAVPPLCCHVGRSLSWPPICAPSQPCCHVHDCPPPRRCYHPEFSTSLTPPSLGSGYHFFAAFYTFATAGCRCPGNLKPSLLLLPAATFWESC